MSYDWLAGIPGYEELPLQQPPPGVTSNFIDPENIGYQVYIASGVCLCILTAVALARLYVKTRLLRKQIRDDMPFYVAVAACMSYIVSCIILIHGDAYGKHTWDIQLKIMTVDQLRLIYSLEIIYGPIIWLAKLPLVLMYLEIFGRLRWLKILSWVVLTLTGLYYLSTAIAIAIVCRSANSNGQLDWISAMASPQCYHGDMWLSLSLGAISIAVDVFLLILPLPAIWSLQLSTSKKWAISGLVFTGITAIVCSCVALRYRIILSSGINPGDTFWYTAPMFASIIAEMTCAVFIGAAPSISILWKRRVKSKTLTSGTIFSRVRTHKATLKDQVDDSDSSHELNHRSTLARDKDIVLTREYFVHTGDLLIPKSESDSTEFC